MLGRPVMLLIYGPYYIVMDDLNLVCLARGTVVPSTFDLVSNFHISERSDKNNLLFAS